MRQCMISVAMALGTILSPNSVFAGEVEEKVEQRVMDELNRMVELFESKEAIEFSAVAITEDVSSSLQKLQYDTTLEGALQRPNQLYLKKSGAEQATLWFDGQVVTILDRKTNKYAKIPLAGNFAELIKKLDSLGIETPFAGLFSRDILKHVEDHVFKGDFYGSALIDGVATNHMTFRQDAIDWQLWTVADTGAPKKVVITSKMLASAPQHMLLIKEVTTSKASLAPEVFQAQIPKDAVEVQIQQDDSESIREGNW